LFRISILDIRILPEQTFRPSKIYAMTKDE